MQLSISAEDSGDFQVSSFFTFLSRLSRVVSISPLCKDNRGPKSIVNELKGALVDELQ